MVQVPADGLRDPFLKGVNRGPSQLGGDLPAIQGVAPIVARPVLDIGDQAFRLAQGGQDEADDLQVVLSLPPPML